MTVGRGAFTLLSLAAVASGTWLAPPVLLAQAQAAAVGKALDLEGAGRLREVVAMWRQAIAEGAVAPGSSGSSGRSASSGRRTPCSRRSTRW